MGRTWPGRVYDLCVYYMTGTPEGSTEIGFMEKPEIEPATPGLQGIDVASDVGVNFKNVGVLSIESSLFHLFHFTFLQTKHQRKGY